MKKTTLLFASAFLAASVTLASVTETVDKTYPFAASGVISLANVNGDVDIVGWDKNEVHLVAEKRARNGEELKQISVHISAHNEADSGRTESRLVIKTEFPKTLPWFRWFGSRNHQGSVRYKLMVPAGVSLKKIDVVNSDITVSGVHGSVDLDTVNGSIDASGLTANGRFDTVNGSIRVDFDSVKAGAKIVLDSVNGSCRIKLPKEASFQLDADNVNGSVSCEFPITLEKSGRHHLRGRVGDGAATVRLDSVNGSLHIKSK